MKKHLFTLIFALGISVGLCAVQTYAQSTQGIQADIPFAFGVNNRNQPAGTYRIDSANSDRTVWRLQEASSKPGEYLLAGSLAGGGPNDGTLLLTFHRYGDKYFLVSFNTPSYEVALPSSKAEKALRSSGGMLSKMDVIAIETVAARSF